MEEWNEVLAHRKRKSEREGVLMPLHWRVNCAFVLRLITLAASTARADITQTAVLGDGWYLNLDTGKVTAAPAAAEVYDLRYTNLTIAPQGSAKVYNLGTRTAQQFANLTEPQIRAQLVLASKNPIAASALVIGDVFIALTNDSNASKVMVSRTGPLALTFTTFQSAPPGVPTITGVLNNSSRIGAGLPNSGIAPSSLFVVTGSAMSDPGDPVLQSSASPGLQTTLMGASIAVTVNGVTTNPALWYASPTQLAAVLPARTPTGNGTLTVAYNGLTSAPFAIQVVPSAVGLNAYDKNYGVATDAFTGALLTFIAAGMPGQTIVLWATGLGADPADSDTTYTATPNAVSTPMQIWMGGVQAKILYQGASVYPGVNQINVQIPDSVPLGCWVPIAAITRVVVSNIPTLPISKDGGECVDAATGLTGSQISPGVNTKFRAGLVGLTLSSPNSSPRTIQYTAGGSFVSYSALNYDPGNSLTPGGCIIREPVTAPSVSVGLDAGSLSMTGPNGLDVTLALQFGIKGLFASDLANGAIPQTGGTFTFKGTGGADVGSFTSTLMLSNPLLVWTNPNVVTTIDKSAGVTVNWTGGNPGSYVYINGSAGTGAEAQVFECLTYADNGKFTIPPYVLLGLPNGIGAVGVQNIIYAPLNASGLDVATAAAYIGYTYAANFAVSGTPR
jgi:uncharacterized protein (TIGR03437 family)